MGFCDDHSTCFSRGAEELEFLEKRREKSEAQKVLKFDEVRKDLKTFHKTPSQDVGGRPGRVALAFFYEGVCTKRCSHHNRDIQSPYFFHGRDKPRLCEGLRFNLYSYSNLCRRELIWFSLLTHLLCSAADPFGCVGIRTSSS
jgi:hypothetical protein